jgi:hypothetical protein
VGDRSQEKQPESLTLNGGAAFHGGATNVVGDLLLQRDFLRRVGKSGAVPTAFCSVGTLVGK